MRQGKHFTRKIQQLADEIKFALQWQSPIILLVVYRSLHVRDDAESALSVQLAKLNQELIRVRMQRDSFKINDAIAIMPQKNKVFSITDLDQGGGEDHADAYRALNLHREYFIEENIRCVFWVTEQEAQRLSSIAPDFWAFRHRVIDIVGNRATPKSSTSFQGLAWIEWPWQIFEQDYKESLAYRERLLADLPDESETVVMRINLYAEIAGLYVQEENWEQALDSIKGGLAIMPSLMLSELKARLFIGLAIIYIQLEYYDQALAYLQKVVILEPESGDALVLLAQASRLAGRRSKALEYIKKAVSLQPERASAWNEYGNISADLGRGAQALDAYKKAYTFSQEHLTPLINMSATLASTGRLEEALKLLADKCNDEVVNLSEISKMEGFEFLKK